ncbi:MAG TPA: pilus assembly protein TadG-related protein [Acidimicrobiia bacterium]|nr:pilus assembly protein TadG-related protein [Acidimicrobiia bacterium]
MTAQTGSMTVVMSGVIAIVAFAAVAVASLGTLYAARAQAINAADAGALAAAVATYPPASSIGPATAALEVIARNGAVLVDCLCPRRADLVPRTVEVVAGVRVEVPIFGTFTVKSASRAEFDPLRWLGR